MIVLLLLGGVILELYKYARKVKNDPLKSQLDGFFDKTNQKISISIRKPPKFLLDELLKLSSKGLGYAFLFGFLIILLPEKIRDYLMPVVGAVFITNALLNLSVSWMLHHKKTLKETFLNFQMIGFLFFPTLIYLTDSYLSTEQGLGQLSVDFHQLVSSFRVNIFYFQFIWATVVIAFIYLGTSFIALPTYIVLYTIIRLLAYLIQKIETAIDNHILDGLERSIKLIGVIITATVGIVYYFLS